MSTHPNVIIFELIRYFFVTEGEQTILLQQLLKLLLQLLHLLRNYIRCLCSEEGVAALTMFPLKSMVGNFLLMYLMADSMPLSVRKAGRVVGSAQVCSRGQDNVEFIAT